jgi:murein DD-endopeptidase MepM/ murein hydrolase activator NlpD
MGEICFIQQYFDHDPSNGAKDYRCGPMVYDGHDGVDLRVPSMAAQRRGVEVIAAAAGTVKGARDGMADVSVRTAGKESIAGRECGNGVVIAHAGGWETQYCHMAKGSLRVRPGQQVEAGTPLGLVGMSGEAEFPHLHFLVRRNGQKLDPFAADAPTTCGSARSLWSAAAASALAYQSPALINSGFAAQAVTMEDIESGTAGTEPPALQSPSMIAFVRVIGLKAGDVQTFTLRGPRGGVVARAESPPLDRNMAQRFTYIGGRKTGPEWPTGTYEAEITVQRDGKAALDRRFSFELR